MVPKDPRIGTRHGVRYALRGRRSGFTLIELILVIVLLIVASAIAIPPLGRMRVTAGIHNGKHAVISTLSLARATAIRYGRPAVLRIDASGDRVWVEVDTSVAGTGARRDTLGIFNLNADLAVDLQSDRSTLCFTSRGIGTTNGICPVAGARIVLSLADQADTLNVSALGRVID